jgi:hypothetical protein
MTLGGAAAAQIRLIVWCRIAATDPGEMAIWYGVRTTVPDRREMARMFPLRQLARRYDGGAGPSGGAAYV